MYMYVYVYTRPEAPFRLARGARTVSESGMVAGSVGGGSDLALVSSFIGAGGVRQTLGKSPILKSEERRSRCLLHDMRRALLSMILEAIRVHACKDHASI